MALRTSSTWLRAKRLVRCSALPHNGRSFLRQSLVAASLSVVLLAVSSRAAAQQSDSLWQDEWNRVTAAEVAISVGLFGAATLGFLFAVRDDTSWHGGILFDDAVRNGLTLQSRGGRDASRWISDITLAAEFLYPTAVDAGLIAWLLEEDPDTAWQILGMDALSFSVTAASLVLARIIVNRERPYVQECAADPAYSGRCGESDHPSFFSGHTAFAFTGAGLVCAHHLNLRLHGGGAPDTIACVSALVLAASTSLLRLFADEHYVSDVLVGAVIGFGSGFVLPTAIHYGFED